MGYEEKNMISDDTRANHSSNILYVYQTGLVRIE